MNLVKALNLWVIICPIPQKVESKQARSYFIHMCHEIIKTIIYANTWHRNSLVRKLLLLEKNALH